MTPPPDEGVPGEDGRPTSPTPTPPSPPAEVKAEDGLVDSVPTASLLVQRARAHKRLEDFEAALRDCSEAVRLNPRDVDAYALACTAHVRRGDVDRAAAILAEGLAACGSSSAIAPLHEQLVRFRGDLQATQRAIDAGDATRAGCLLADIRAAFGGWGDSPVVRALVCLHSKLEGKGHWAARRWAEAEAEASAALAHAAPGAAPLLAVLHANRAAAWTELGQLKHALGDCLLAIQYDGTYAKAFLRRALFYLRLHLLDEALEDLLAAKARGLAGVEAEIRAVYAEAAAALPGGVHPYRVLQVAEGASGVEVRQAYRQAALQWHPDKCPPPPGMTPATAQSYAAVCERVFKLVANAHDVLSDRGRRAQLDQRLRAAPRGRVLLRPEGPAPYPRPRPAPAGRFGRDTAFP
eukprot:EG_transcript_11630